MKKGYAQQTDEALIARLRAGEAQVADYLMEKYKKMVRAKASRMYLIGGEPEDLIQEGMIGLFKAVRDYDEGQKASFRTFAELCVTRQMYNAIEAAGRLKNLPLNTYVSLYEETGRVEDGTPQILEELLAADEQKTPEEEVLALEKAAYLRAAMEEDLSPMERRVTQLYLTGMTSGQIAQILNKTVKATDNALTRAKAKLRKRLRLL